MHFTLLFTNYFNRVNPEIRVALREKLDGRTVDFKFEKNWVPAEDNAGISVSLRKIQPRKLPMIFSRRLIVCLCGVNFIIEFS
jgi:hypothetical protein